MDKDANSEILIQSELTVKAAKKELNKTLDYSIDSLKELEVLIQHVRNHIVKLKREGKQTEQTIQRASISIGGYLGEVIRRHHGGNWVAKNAIMKTLVINGQEVSPILYVYQRLSKDSEYSLENYWSDIHRMLYPLEKIEKEHPVPEAPKKTSSNLMGDKRFMIGALLSTVVLCIFAILGIAIKNSNSARTPSTITPRSAVTRIHKTPTSPIIRIEPINYLQNLPGGFAVDDSINSNDETLEDGTRYFDVVLINRQAVNPGDLVNVQYLVAIFPDESKAVSTYYQFILDLEGKDGVLDSEINIAGTDDSAMYLSYEDNNIVQGQYISRVKNIMITTIGLSTYDPQTVTNVFLQVFMVDVLELHNLGINNTR
jgi:hypothetical protein